MNYYSTNNHHHRVSLSEAVLNGLAPDNGLYLPEKIPVLSPEKINAFPKQSFQEIAFTVANALLGEDISEMQLTQIIDHTISFDAPLVEVKPDIYSLELFHGPTLAFKDFGARFMSQVLRHFAEQQKQEAIILVATSGDTGSAVANGFLGVPGTRVIVLYPSGKVSEIQEKQFTTLGKNIVALEVNGTFDDCQRLVKESFVDQALQKKFFLTSANSINIARLIPQSFYYFYAWSRLPKRNQVVFSVPSGNFGNLTAGLIAKKMGLPISHFIAATNINDIIPKYLESQLFEPRPSSTTISNAMDVGNPSNFARMIDLYENDFSALSNDISGYSFTDEETQATMRKIFNKAQYLLDPHGAIGYLGLKKYLQHHTGVTGVFLETAHPAKFLNVVERTLNQSISVPPTLQQFLSKQKQSISVSSSFQDLKSTLLKIL